MIILVGSNKGGAGKTTTAITLATGFAEIGLDICLLDADHQSSATRWSTDRESSGRDLKQITCIQRYGNLQPTLNNLKDKYDHIIIDSPGRNSRELITAMLCADILVAPAQTSQLDLDTLEELQEQVIRALDYNKNLTVLIYNVMASTNPRVVPNDTRDFKAFLKDFENFVILDSYSCYRKVYRDVMPDGISVIEQGNDLKAKAEGENLIKEVLTYDN
jgi:chromosome partitioning protein